MKIETPTWLPRITVPRRYRPVLMSAAILLASCQMQEKRAGDPCEIPLYNPAAESSIFEPATQYVAGTLQEGANGSLRCIQNK